MRDITITELESAINYWRQRSPSTGDELALCPEASSLSHTYALMIYSRRQAIAETELAPAARAALDTFVRST